MKHTNESTERLNTLRKRIPNIRDEVQMLAEYLDHAEQQLDVDEVSDDLMSDVCSELYGLADLASELHDSLITTAEDADPPEAVEEPAVSSAKEVL